MTHHWGLLLTLWGFVKRIGLCSLTLPGNTFSAHRLRLFLLRFAERESRVMFPRNTGHNLAFIFAAGSGPPDLLELPTMQQVFALIRRTPSALGRTPPGPCGRMAQSLYWSHFVQVHYVKTYPVYHLPPEG